MDNDERFMTLAGYAASRNLSPQYVGRLRTAGIVIIAANGKVDAAASDRLRSEKIRARMPVTRRQKHGRDSYLEARTRREIVAAEREQVLLDQLRGRLVDADRILKRPRVRSVIAGHGCVLWRGRCHHSWRTGRWARPSES